MTATVLPAIVLPVPRPDDPDRLSRGELPAFALTGEVAQDYHFRQVP
ncbi:hypothetical protein [Deinococcus sp.]|nr:hypothetical protein [Deinococcus sp.]